MSSPLEMERNVPSSYTYTQDKLGIIPTAFNQIDNVLANGIIAVYVCNSLLPSHLIHPLNLFTVSLGTRIATTGKNPNANLCKRLPRNCLQIMHDSLIHNYDDCAHKGQFKRWARGEANAISTDFSQPFCSVAVVTLPDSVRSTNCFRC